jgi:tight adherence protein C
MSVTTLLLAALAAGIAVLLTLLLAGRRETTLDPAQRLAASGAWWSKPKSDLEELELSAPFSERVLRPMLLGLSRLVARLISASYLTRAETRLLLAGSPKSLKPREWLGVKAGLAIVGLILIPLLFVSSLSIGPVSALPGAMVGGLLGFMLPEIWLSGRIRTRQKAVLRSIPDVLDLLVISVRAGLSFDAALAKVVEKMSGPLTDEFARALAEVRVGRARADALRDIIARTEVPSLSVFISAILQAEELGVSISKVLTVQSEQLRVERRQRAEELAAKAPIKMLFPLVGCIFPALLIVLLGPAFIVLYKALVLRVL